MPKWLVTIIKRRLTEKNKIKRQNQIDLLFFTRQKKKVVFSWRMLDTM